MSVAFVKSTTQASQTSDGSNHVTISVNYTAGNTLLLVTGYNHNTYGTVTVTDTQSNTWTQTDQSPQTDFSTITIHTFTATNVTGSSATVTVSYGGSVRAAITVSEWSGVDTTTPVNGVVRGQDISGSSSVDIFSSFFNSHGYAGAAGDAIAAAYTNYYSPTWSVDASSPSNPSGFAVESGSTTTTGDGLGNIGMGYALLSSAYAFGTAINPGTTDYGYIIALILKAAAGGGGGLVLGWLPMTHIAEGQAWVAVPTGTTTVNT